MKPLVLDALLTLHYEVPPGAFREGVSGHHQAFGCPRSMFKLRWEIVWVSHWPDAAVRVLEIRLQKEFPQQSHG